MDESSERLKFGRLFENPTVCAVETHEKPNVSHRSWICGSFSFLQCERSQSDGSSSSFYFSHICSLPVLFVSLCSESLGVYSLHLEERKHHRPSSRLRPQFKKSSTLTERTETRRTDVTKTKWSIVGNRGDERQCHQIREEPNVTLHDAKPSNQESVHDCHPNIKKQPKLLKNGASEISRVQKDQRRLRQICRETRRNTWSLASRRDFLMLNFSDFYKILKGTNHHYDSP